jgi:hypothetical protein
MLIKDSKDTRFYWERDKNVPLWLVDVLIAAFKDTKVLAKLLFPEDYEADFSTLHNQIFDLLDSGARRMAIAAPRGIGKTTIAGTLIARSILYETHRVIPYVSKSETFATIQTENIKYSLTANEEVKVLFGNVKYNENFPGLDMFSKKGWVANGHTLVMPRGAGQQIRGLKWIHYRPDLIIFDDLEDDETIDNEEQRKKLVKWFFSSAIKAVPRLHKNWRILYIDTIKHEDSLLVKLLEEKTWESLCLSICDDDYKTLAPDFMEQAELDEEVDTHRRLHIMDIFAREYQSKVVSSEDAAFKEEFFEYYKEDDKEFQNKLKDGQIISVVIGDPAKTAKMHNAESGVVCWGIDIESNLLYFRGGYGDHVTPDGFFKMLTDYVKLFKASVVGVEDTGLDDWIRHPFKSYMLSNGFGNINICFLSAKQGKGEFAGIHGGKLKRIASLIPYYQAHRIKHNFSGSAQFESQLISFPRSKRMDVMDAAAYIVKMMNDEQIYFGDQMEVKLPPLNSYKDEYAGLHYVDDYDLANGLAFV